MAQRVVVRFAVILKPQLFLSMSVKKRKKDKIKCYRCREQEIFENGLCVWCWYKLKRGIIKDENPQKYDK